MIQESQRKIKPDLSALVLIVSNIIIIYFAIKEDWSLLSIMFIYWAQSVIIGIFTFLKIISLKKFSTKNFRINRRPVEPTKFTKYYTAFFFLIHYGIFHFVYLIFLLSGILSVQKFDYAGIFYTIFGIIIFFINHLFSYLYNYKKDSEKIKNIGTIMFFPYARIVPMHLAIVFGFAASSGGTVFFLILKTIADVVMHFVEHKI